MTDVMETTGTLEVVLARGVKTAYEAATLKPGHLVSFGDRECGAPVSLYFNSHHLGTGEVVVVDESITIEITKLTWTPPPIGLVGEADDVVELLETRLVLVRAQVRLGDLRGAGEYTVLVFGKRVDAVATVELTANDMTVAVGQACFRRRSPLYHLHTPWAVQISEVSATIAESPGPHASGWVDTSPSESPRAYDFSFPDRMSKEQVRNVSLIHERFADNLNVATSSSEQFHVAWVDQFRHSQLMARLPVDGHHLAFEMPARARSTDAGKRYVVEVERGEALTDNKLAELEATATRNASAPAFSRFYLGHRAGGALARVREQTGMLKLINLLRNAWKRRIIIDPPSAHELSRDAWEESVPHEDTLICAGLQVGEKDIDDVIVVCPYVHIRKIISLLG